MATYTYDQFEQAARNSGLYNQFSAADLSLAQQNPDAGMSILKYKQDFANATTDEARALANLGAENIRSSYGNYTGGADGSSFALDPLSPSSFNAGTAPSFSSKATGDVADLWEQQKNYGTYSYDVPQPTYDNRYDATIQELLNQIVNRQDFSYDPATDPLYSQYRKEYAREGQRATQDALGAAAAASGGMPSSYANTAAAQAANYYAAQMTDKIPELEQLAYNKYLNEYNMKLSDLSAVQGAEQSDYAKYQGDLAQYNADRSFDYAAWLDQYNMIANNLQAAQGMEQNDWQKYLTELDQWNADRSFNYAQLLDEINSQTLERQEELNKAQIAADLGDYSFLQDMGINTANNPADWERQYNLALLAAQYGDYSGLQALGVTPNMENVNSAALASGGNYGKSVVSGGGNPSGDDQDDIPTLDSTIISQTILNALKSKYPSGVVTDTNMWNSLVSQYGEAALQAAGFTNQAAGGENGYKSLKYADLSPEAKNIADLIDSDLTTNYARAAALIKQISDENEQEYLLQMIESLSK